MYGGPERSKELQTKEIPANRKMLKKHTKDSRTWIKHNSSSGLLVRYVTKHLKKWQQSSAKWLIANIYLQYYMNHVKTLHVFLPHNMDDSCAPFKRVSVQCFAAGPSNKRLPQKHLFFCSDLTSTVFYSASVFCFVFSFPMCFLCIWRHFRRSAVLKLQRLTSLGHRTNVRRIEWIEIWKLEQVRHNHRYKIYNVQVTVLIRSVCH